MTVTSHPHKRILLIDDDFTTREVMSVILAADGYCVSVASNGADALARLRTSPLPEVILLDLKMPVMDGCAFCEHRRENPALAAVPVVVLSGLPNAAEQARKLGATACLQKPIDPIQLLAVVREYTAEPVPAVC